MSEARDAARRRRYTGRPDIPPHLTKYVTGGCLDYAHAFVDTHGGVLVAVVSSSGVHHVVTELQGAFYDVFGAHTVSELLAFWSEECGEPVEIRRATDDDLVGYEEDETRYEEALGLAAHTPLARRCKHREEHGQTSRCYSCGCPDFEVDSVPL